MIAVIKYIVGSDDKVECENKRDPIYGFGNLVINVLGLNN